MLTKEVATKVLKECLATGADFAEIFCEVKKSNVISMVSRMIKNSDTSITNGVGIRVLKGLQETYGYTNEVDEESVLKLAKTLASSYDGEPLGIDFDLVYTETPKMVSTTRYSKDIPNTEKVKYLSTCSEAAYGHSEKIVQVMANFTDETQEVTIFNSNGLWRSDVRNHQRITCQAIAKEDAKMEAYYDQYGGNFGVEYFDNYDFETFAKEIAEGALNQLKAVDIPGGVYDVVIHNAFGGVIFHEACGHSLEATSVAKNLSVFIIFLCF